MNETALPIISGLFGENVDFRKLLGLVVLQAFKNPDNYIKVKTKNILQVMSEKLNLINNWSSLKSDYQSIFEKLNKSDEKTFYYYMNFMWYSSLPCFDVENFTAGVNFINILCAGAIYVYRPR